MKQVGPLFLSLECFFILLLLIKIDFQAFLDVLEKKENDSTVKVNLSPPPPPPNIIHYFFPIIIDISKIL